MAASTGAVIALGMGLLGGGAVAANQMENAAQRKANSLRNSLGRPITTPKVMPNIDSEAVKNARKQWLLRMQQQGSGRESTILTQQPTGLSTTFGG